MSEYQEALSRLNMPERTPGMTISRSLFPITRKDTPYNMDRILRETLNTPLPKYSIPQRLFINSDSSVINSFPLEKHFCLAQGGRKAIAVREINLEQEDEQQDFLFLTISGYIKQFNDKTAATLKNIGMMNEGLAIHKYVSFNRYLIEIGQTISTKLNDKFNEVLRTAGEIADDEEFSPFSYVIHGDSITISADESKSNEYMFSNVIITLRNQKEITPTSILGLVNNETLRSKSTYVSLNDGDKRIYYITLTPTKTFEPPYSVCSTINPWSPGNVIGSCKQFYTNLNKLFPYDNQQEVKIWITNGRGNTIPNNLFNGYIDLELIIDNLNNFAMDD